jgi:hypothetical protein
MGFLIVEDPNQEPMRYQSDRGALLRHTGHVHTAEAYLPSRRCSSGATCSSMIRTGITQSFGLL